MTFAAISARRHLRPRYWLEVQGIEPVFVESTLAPSDVVGDRTQLVVIQPEGLAVGESRLDFERLAESGASLNVRLRDTPAGALAALFAMRSRRVARLADTVARTAVLDGDVGDELELDDNTALSTGGTGYVAAETFTWTGKSGATTLTGVTRALYGSRPQTLVGGAEEGMDVFLVPPVWVGRRVALKAVYLDDRGAPIFADADDVTTLGTFLLEAPVQHLGGG
jgi:hypothetical protein